jgi:hypothetical protein
MELFGAVIGLSVVTWILVAVAAGLVFPVFWLWMLVDAIVREQAAFPSHDMAEKVMWIVLMLAIQPVAALYFFLVWRPGRAQQAQVAPVPGPAAPAAA